MKFNVIAADPAWKFKDALHNKDDVARSAEDNYKVMNLEDIMGMDVCELSDDWCVLALWCPASMYFTHGHEVMTAWGFSYRQEWIWVKTGQGEYIPEEAPVPEDPKLAFGMGRLARSCKEGVLIGIKGKVYNHLATHSERDVIFSPDRGHSVKPEELQDKLDRMFPTGERLELFARRSRPGWICCGLECPDTLGEDIRTSIKYLTEG